MKDAVYFMNEALKEAKKAYAKGEVPVGCVIVSDGKILARGHNQREKKNDPTSHAEIEAIRKACKKRNSWRLEDCDLYVTVEPCSMCAGAILWARMKKVYYGTSDPKGGALGSSYHLYEQKNLNHHPETEGGILQEECKHLMKSFFKERRD